MKLYLCAGALVLGALSGITQAKSDDKLTGINQFLTRAPKICADFTQTKTLRALKRPLVSTGRVVFLADKGILWQVRDPFPTRLLVKNDALVRWNESGEPQRIGFEQSPIFGALARVFMAMFTGELDPLREAFGIDSHMENSRWRLSLTPREEGLAKIFARIYASGGRFVDKLQIEENLGDQTLITFTNMTSTTCRPDKSETDYFAQ